MARDTRIGGETLAGSGAAPARPPCKPGDALGEVPRDAIYYRQLARQARRLAAGHTDPLVARRLRESAVRHENMARQLQRDEERSMGTNPIRSSLQTLVRRLRGRE